MRPDISTGKGYVDYKLQTGGSNSSGSGSGGGGGSGGGCIWLIIAAVSCVIILIKCPEMLVAMIILSIIGEIIKEL